MTYNFNSDNISMDCLTPSERCIISQLLIKHHNDIDDELIKEGCQLILNKIYIDYGVDTGDDDNDLDDIIDELRNSLQ